MSTIPKPGDLVLIKTTEEPVIVLETRILSQEDSLKLAGGGYGNMPSRTLLQVRRPVAGQNGISHQVDTFYLEEVEFPADRTSRLRAEYNAMQVAEKTAEPAAKDPESKSSIN